VEHFSGLGPETLSPPPVPQFHPNGAAAEPPRVDVSTPPPVATSSTSSTPLTSTTTIEDAWPSSSDLQRQIATTPSEGGRPFARLAGDGTMDLDAYRELFRQQNTLPVAEVYGAMGDQSTSHDAYSANYHDDDDDEGDYIRHFHDKDSTVQPARPAPHPRQDLLGALEDINTKSNSKHEVSSEAAKDYPVQNGANGYHSPTRHLEYSDLDDESEPLEEMYNDEATLEELVEPPYRNEIEFNEQKRSDDEGIARTINNSNGEPDYAHLKAPTQAAGEMDSFSQRLRNLHQQDMARDELLIDLHKEVQDLRQALKAEARGSQPSPERPESNGDDPRAAAAERSLIEARQDMQKNPFVYVLIDGEGYVFHEDLLQAGQLGGVEAADRLFRQIQDHMAGFNNSKYWDVMVHMYMDVEGLLNSCNASNVSLSEHSLRGFMRGLQSLVGPLFNIVEVGQARDNTSRKIEGMFHLFANNVQCKRIFFGCCHDCAYVMALSAYTGNPLIAPRITLLASRHNGGYYDALNYEIIDLPYVFRPISISAKSPLARNSTGNDEYGDLSSQSNTRTPSTISDQPMEGSRAVTEWQKAAKDSSDGMTVSLPRRLPSDSPRKGRKQERTVLLNINDERVDPRPEEEDLNIKESMLDRMEEREFCVFHHLRGGCLTESLSKCCRFRHGPSLNEKELTVLKHHVRRSPCDKGPRCRLPNCMYGHVCPNQPGCHWGARCQLNKFHAVDPTAVKVWRPCP